MAKYLVSGGAGFIGSHIVERLVKQGEVVRVVDNLSTGRIENLDNCIDRIEFLNGDLKDYSVAAKAVDGVEFIIHEAALPSVQMSIDNPINVNDSIVSTTINILKAAVESNTVKRVVQAASAAAYGDSAELPKHEDMVPNPLSPYAVAKLTQEYYGKAFYNVYGLEVVSLRYFNVFGPKQDPKSAYAGVISIFLDKILKGEQPIIFGDGQTSRDFVYIDDVVNANLLACHYNWSKDAQVINIGTGTQISLNDLVKSINHIMGTNIMPIHREDRVGDIKHSLADISKAREILGYKALVNFEEGLKKLIDWYKCK